MQTIQEFIKAKNDEIEKTAQDFEIVRAQKLAELQELQNKCDSKISSLQHERDMRALEEKLKGFPAALVKNHKVCSICGSEMRPSQFIEDEKLKRAWVCQTAQPNHDLIIVSE